jgi:hypothetical protein
MIGSAVMRGLIAAGSVGEPLAPPEVLSAGVYEYLGVGGYQTYLWLEFDQEIDPDSLDEELIELEIGAEAITLGNPAWENASTLRLETSRTVIAGETITASTMQAGAVAGLTGVPNTGPVSLGATNTSTRLVPDQWQPWYWWQGEDAIDSTNFSWPSHPFDLAPAFAQTTDANEPGVSTASANWNGRDTVTFVPNDQASVATTGGFGEAYLSLSALQFLHDGSQSYELLMLVRPAATAGNDIVLSTYATNGIRLNSDPGAGTYTYEIYASSALQLSVAATGCVAEKESLVRVRFDSSTGTLSLSVDYGTPVTDSGGSLNYSNGGALYIGRGNPAATSYFEGEIPFLHISKFLPDSTRKAAQQSYFEEEYGLAFGGIGTVTALTFESYGASVYGGLVWTSAAVTTGTGIGSGSGLILSFSTPGDEFGPPTGDPESVTIEDGGTNYPVGCIVSFVMPGEPESSFNYVNFEVTGVA